MSKRKKNSAQQLMGIEDITDYSIVTRQGELVFFVISPTNLSVLPESGISARINALLNVIRTNDGLELMASDAMQSFEFNKHFYRDRLEKEPLPAIRNLLQKDMEYLDGIQVMAASSRQFFLILRIQREIKGDIYAFLGDVEKYIHEQGFTVHRADKQELKGLLAVYYEQNMTAVTFDDVDGQRWME